MPTTAPAARFNVAATTGTVEVGKDGDLVLLERDPMQDATAFATVYMTIRDGRVVWRKP